MIRRPSDCCQCHTISSERIQHGDSLTQTPFYCGRGQVIINGMGHMRKFHINGPVCHVSERDQTRSLQDRQIDPCVRNAPSIEKRGGATR